jgi:phage terminase small subunit
MPKVKSISEHIKQGTFRSDRHTATALQPIHEKLPEPSQMLKGTAKEIYYIETDFLNKNGLLNPAWLWQIEMMCINIAIAYDCLIELNDLKGSDLMVAIGAQPQFHPVLRLMWKSYGEAHKIACQLGITPISFTRFKMLEQQTEKNEFDEIEEM